MIKWIMGNTLPLAVPLKTVTKTESGIVTEDYIPPQGSELLVTAVGKYKRKQYDYQLDGNVVLFADDGTLSAGTYGIEIRVTEPTKNLRCFKCGELQIVNCSEELELGEFVQDGAVFLEAMPYFFAKGDKGEKGDAGTTDYNELANKPDLSNYAQTVTEQEFNTIFT